LPIRTCWPRHCVRSETSPAQKTPKESRSFNAIQKGRAAPGKEALTAIDRKCQRDRPTRPPFKPRRHACLPEHAIHSALAKECSQHNNSVK
jgi:hypothetical protein